MRISALEEYGLRCLLNLAREGEGGQLTIHEIAQNEGLSVPYTSKLLSILRKSGLISSLRGRGGGFCISRPASEINLLEVLTALGGPLIDPDHCTRFAGQQDTCVHVMNCSVHYVLDGLAGYIGEFLSETSLQQIIDSEPLVQIRQIRSNVNLSGTPSQLSATQQLVTVKEKTNNPDNIEQP